LHTETSHRNAIVVVVEGLGTALAGAYGSNLARTPVLDQIAARGIVLDQCFVDSTRLPAQLTSLWTGRHAMQPESDLPTIWHRCHQAGQSACLITDNEQVALEAERAGCEEAYFVSAEHHPAPVQDIAFCELMHLFAAAGELLAKREGLVWIHSAGLRLAWDAPVHLRNEFADPEDPDPPGELGPPNMSVTSETDPDLITGWSQVAAAQASVVDEGIAQLLAVVGARPDADNWSWILSSLGGTPLGEHDHLGPRSGANGNAAVQAQPYGEELGCVSILVPAGGRLCGSRRGELLQLPDLAVTLAGMLGLAAVQAAQPPWGRDILRLSFSDSPVRWAPGFQLACLQSDRQLWIRCPAWSAVLPVESLVSERAAEVSDPQRELQTRSMAAESGYSIENLPRLYVKPEDRWEVNDVADRRRDLVEQLEVLAHQFRLAARNNCRDAWGPLPDELVNLMR
jgi:hypothetical protein